MAPEEGFGPADVEDDEVPVAAARQVRPQVRCLGDGIALVVQGVEPGGQLLTGEFRHDLAARSYMVV